MSVRLLDANILIALAWPRHARHAAVTKWFKQHSAEGWATCPLTESAFVRITSNPRMLPNSVSPVSAMVMLNALTRYAGYEFWPDDLPLRIAFEETASITGHNQITDAYLLALAMQRGGTLATLDSGIRNLIPAQKAGASSLEVLALD